MNIRTPAEDRPGTLNALFPVNYEWPVADRYVWQDGYLKPRPGAKFRKYAPFNVIADGSTTEPLYVRLANTLRSRDGDFRVDPIALENFVAEFGLLGLGWRYAGRIEGWIQLKPQRIDRHLPIRTVSLSRGLL